MKPKMAPILVEIGSTGNYICSKALQFHEKVCSIAKFFGGPLLYPGIYLTPTHANLKVVQSKIRQSQ
jgi:hypothetical protein